MEQQVTIKEKSLTYNELIEKIRNQFDELSPQFQTAAKFLLDQPDDVAVSSMRSVAALASVQSATLVRLAQHLGFAGWPELKTLFVERLRASPDRYASKAKSLANQAAGGNLIGDLFRTQRANIDLLESNNASGSIEDAAQLIENANKVYIAGFRACHPIAFAFQYLYRLFRPDVYLLGGNDGTIEMGLRAIQKDDVVLVASFFPYSKEAVTVTRMAERKGCKIVALTDSAASPLALKAHATILFSIESPSFFPTVTAGLAAVEALVELLASRGGDQAIHRIEEAEQQLFELGYVMEKKPPRSS